MYQDIRTVLRFHALINSKISLQHSTLNSDLLSSLKAEMIRHINARLIAALLDIINNFRREPCGSIAIHDHATHANCGEQRVPLVKSKHEKISWEEWLSDPSTLATVNPSRLDARKKCFKAKS